MSAVLKLVNESYSVVSRVGVSYAASWSSFPRVASLCALWSSHTLCIGDGLGSRVVQVFGRAHLPAKIYGLLGSLHKLYDLALVKQVNDTIPLLCVMNMGEAYAVAKGLSSSPQLMQVGKLIMPVQVITSLYAIVTILCSSSKGLFFIKEIQSVKSEHQTAMKALLLMKCFIPLLLAVTTSHALFLGTVCTLVSVSIDLIKADNTKSS